MPATPRFALVLLLACAPLLPAQAREAKPADGATGQVLEPVMAGEFALQAGRLQDSAQWYLQAAQRSSDVGLAELATRIALLANDDGRARQALGLWQRRAPASMAMRMAAATLDLREGNARRARRELQALLRDPDPEAWRYAVAALSGGRDPAVTGAVLGQLLEDKALPNDLALWLAFGGLAQKLDQPKLAEQVIDQVVVRFPANPRVALLHASQLRKDGQDDQARQIMDGLVPQSAADPQLRLALAAEFDAMGLQGPAATTLAQGPQDERTWGLRAALLSRADDDDGLARLYEEVKTGVGPGDGPRRLLLGQIAQGLKRPADALDWYQSVPAGPQQVEARLRAANTLYELGRKADAFQRIHDLQADAAIDDASRRDAYLLEAELRQKDGDDAGEMDALNRGLAAYPDEAALLYARGLAWERRDRIDRAEADLRRVLVTDPDNTAALNALGYTLADRTERYTEALELIDRARAAAPDDGAIIDSYGWVLYRLGRTHEALVQLRRAWTLNKDPEIGAHLGQVLWELGHRDDARRVFDQARKLDPDNRSLQRALQTTGA